VFYIIEHDRKVRWLLLAQGYESIPKSILLPLKVYTNHGLHKRYGISLANLCVAKSDNVIVNTIKLTREF
jgi:hypothetical protein